MGQLRYNVATSLDGYIACQDGSANWIIEDPSIDFDALYAEFDVFVMGRRTYETMLAYSRQSNMDLFSGRPKEGVVVISRTMKPEEHPKITIVSEGHLEAIRRLKREAVKDLWLMGGSELASTCFEAGLVDSVEVAIMPVLLGQGIKLVNTADGKPLKLRHKTREPMESGIIMCKYDVV